MTHDHLPTQLASPACPPATPRQKRSREPAGRLPDTPANGHGCPPLPFSDLALIIPNITPINGTDGALNKAALTVNSLGVICVILAWFEQAAEDFVYLVLNGTQVAQYTVTEEDAKNGKTINLAIDSIRFIDQAQNTLQAFVKRLSGTVSESRPFSIWVDTKAPGGLDPEVSTPVVNENLERITFEDKNIEAFGIINKADITNGVKIFINKYPKNPAVDAVYHRKEGDVVTVSVGGVLVTHTVTYSEAASDDPIRMTIEHGTWLKTTSGPNIVEWFVKDKAGNQSIGFSVPRVIQNRVSGGTTLLMAGNVAESEYDSATDQEYIDKDAHTRDLNFEVPLRRNGWEADDRILVTFLGLTTAGGTLRHTVSETVRDPNIIRALITLPLAFIQQLAGGRMMASYERAREGQPNTPSEAAIYEVRGTPVDNRRPAPVVHGLAGGTLPDVNPVHITVLATGLAPNDMVVLVIEGRTTTGEIVYATYIERASGGDIEYLLDYSIFAPLEGSTFTAYTIVNEDAANPSQSITVPVGDISILLPPPRSPDTPTNHFNELINKGNLRAVVDPHSSILLNDDVRMVATGSKPGGSFTSDWLLVSPIWFGKTLPFSIPRTFVLANKDSDMALHWEVRTLPTDNPLKSQALVIKVGAALELTECPILLEATQVAPCTMRLDPLNVWTPTSKTTTFRVRYPMLASDFVTLHIDGKPGIGTPVIPGKPGIPDPGHDYITFATRSSYIAAYIGEAFEVYCEVRRDNTTTVSPRLKVEVANFSEQTLNLVSVPEASGGVLDTAKANSVQVRGWPFFNDGHILWVQALSTTNRFVRLARAVTLAEVSAGRTLDLIPADYLKDLPDNSEVAINAWASLDGSSNPETAIYFNVPVYRTRKGVGHIEREIRVGHGPTHIAASHDGKTLCVANARSSSISVINLANDDVSSVNTLGTINGLALHPSLPRLFFSVSDTSGIYVTPVLDLHSLTVRYLNWLGNPTRAIFMNPGGTRIYVGTNHAAGIYIFDPITDAYLKMSFSGQGVSRAGIINPQDTAIFLIGSHTERFNTLDRVRTHTIANPAPADSAAHSPSFSPLERLYVTFPSIGRIEIYNTNNNGLTFLKSLNGLIEPKGIAFHPSKRLAYVAQCGGNSVRVINTVTEELADTITGFDLPTGLVCSEDGRYLYVSNNGSNTIAVVAI